MCSQSTDDPKQLGALAFMELYLAIPTLSLSGIHYKILSAAGDRAGWSVLRLEYPLGEMEDHKLKKILGLLVEAFKYPEMISNAADRTPVVTRCLLDSLLSKAKSSEQAEWIQSTRFKIDPVALA